MISPHTAKALREELIEEHNAKYWIGSDARVQTLIQFVETSVVAEFPMTYLIDVRGKIVDHGERLTEKIEYLLEEVFDPALGRELHAALDWARKSYESGQIGSAWKRAGQKLKDDDVAVVADATFLRERCEAYGAWKKLMLEREMPGGNYPKIVPALKKVEKSFRGLPAATWAQKTRRELERDPKVKRELQAWARFEKALVKDKKARGSAKKLRSARKEFMAILAKYPGTLAAREAERRLQR